MSARHAPTRWRVSRSAQPRMGPPLPHEPFPAAEMAWQAFAARAAGSDLIATSDHFHPWQENRGDAGFARITSGIIGQQTERPGLGATVTYLPSLSLASRRGGSGLRHR